MSEKKSFSELLGEAPLATAEKTVSLTGVLARSHEPGKFVLTMADNQSVTLDVDAVKEHKVVSGMVGQLIVQVEVDRDRVPRPGPEATNFRPGTSPQLDATVQSFDVLHTIPAIDSPWTGWWDVKDPLSDFPVKNIFESGGTIQEVLVDPGNVVDPGVLAGQAFGGAAPFALATPHQAPQSALGGAMQANAFRTSPIWDLRTISYIDKPPIADITGHFPRPD